MCKFVCHLLALVFFHLRVYTMHAVYLQEGCNEQQHNPLVVQKVYVGDGAVEKWSEEHVGCVYHQSARKHQENVGHCLNAF